MNAKRLLQIGLIVILVLPFAAPTVVLAKPIASFTWNLSPRYEDSWKAWTGTIYEPNFVTPKTWRVNFDACASEGGGSRIVEYSWRIEGKTLFWFPVVFTSTECKKSFNLPGQGAYQATLTIRTSDQQISSSTRTVIVKDWLIVSIGDSISSGEGNPDQPGDYEGRLEHLTAFNVIVHRPAVWKDQRCHRSALSGPAQAARQIEDNDPDTSVTFLSFACSGAEITHVYSDTYDGEEPHGEKSPLPNQIDAVKTLVGGRQIDALLITAGINDLHITDIVKACATNVQPNLAHPLDDPTCVTNSGIDARLAELPAKYDALAQAISNNLNVAEVYIIDYPENVLDGGGCDLLFGIGSDEAQQLAIEGQQLNRYIRDAADKHHWNMVHGDKGETLTEAFQHDGGHSYCASNTWFVGVLESFKKQGPKLGALHPNFKGHQAIKDFFLKSIRLGQRYDTFTRVTLTIEAVRAIKNTQGVSGISTTPSSLLPDQVGGSSPIPKTPFPQPPPPGNGTNVRISVSGTVYSPPYPLECDFFIAKSDLGKYVSPPSNKCTFTLDVYQPPRSPRHAVFASLTVVSDIGGQVNGDRLYDDKNNYGVGRHEVTNPNGLLTVKYRIAAVAHGSLKQK
jgi:hypothetical protein